MVISSVGINLIKKYEGLSLIAYPDPGTGGKPWTIGYGHTRQVNDGDVVSEEEATHLLMDDVYFAMNCVDDYTFVDLSQNEYDALCSFIFNVGCKAYRTSTLLKLLNLGDKKAAAGQFVRWNKAGGVVLAGLTKRREAEANLFRGNHGL